MSTGINFDTITSTLGAVGVRREGELKTMISGLNEQASTLDLLKLQQQIQQ